MNEIMAQLVSTNHYAHQAWLHIEAGDLVTARAWAGKGMASARVRRSQADENPCLLMIALVLLLRGDRARGAFALRNVAFWFESVFDPVGAGVAWVCVALADSGGRFVALEKADVAFERGMRKLAQAGDTLAWSRVKLLRSRANADASQLLPSLIVDGL